MSTAAKKNKTISKDQDELEIKPVSDPIEEPAEEPKVEVETTSEPAVDATSIPAITPEISFDQEPESDEKQTNKLKSNKGLFMSLVITLVVGGALTGGILYSRSAINSEDVRSKANETQETEITPTITIAPVEEVEEIDLSKYKLQVLNGSGIAGQAGAVDELLQAEGFAESDMDNADSYDYQDTEIQLKSGTPKEVYDSIERALNSDYQVVKGDALDKDSNFDVIVIVGQKL